MKRSIIPAVLILGFFTGAAAAQASAPQPDRAAVLTAAKTIMQSARFCVLTTLGTDGQPQARLLDPFAPEEGMVVWLATNPVTRKVAQIRRDPRVALCYVDPNGAGYVTLLGKAEVVDSAAEKERHWKEEWSSFYKQKNKGSDYVLLRVSPLRLEVVSYADHIVNDPATWEPVSITFPEPPASKTH